MHDAGREGDLREKPPYISGPLSPTPRVAGVALVLPANKLARKAVVQAYMELWPAYFLESTPENYRNYLYTPLRWPAR